MSTRTRRAGAIVAGLASLLITGAVIAAPSATAQDTRPTAVVALGDSAISGEGAGDYEPGTRGENGNWCHRSRNALVHRTQLAQNTINLACSGADSANVSLADTSHYNEGSQARRLVGIAQQYRVTTVVVQIGANDEPEFADSVLQCVGAWVNPFGRSCSSRLAPEWPGRLAGMQPRVVTAVNDVKAAMAEAGYAPGSYNLVLTSYGSPFTENMDATWHGPQGCPIRLSDARWARTSAVTQLSESLRGAAAATGAKFLDFSRSMEGHEACSGRSSSANEWQRRITVDPFAWWYGGLDAFGIHLAQESFHPNATGHGQLGRCLTQFVNSGSASARCLAGADGNLNAVQ